MKNKEWGQFNKSFDKRYQSLCYARRKKRCATMAVFVFIIVGLFIVIDRGIDASCKRAYELSMRENLKLWKDLGEPYGEDLRKLVLSDKWNSSILVSNVSFVYGQKNIETLFAKPYLRTKKVVFITRDGTLIWAKMPSKKIISIDEKFNTNQVLYSTDVKAMRVEKPNEIDQMQD